jgi:hypothetical protein
MALKFSTDLKNYIVNKALVEAMAGTCGTAGTASILVYSGTQPANGDAATSGDLLCTIAAIGWGATTGTTSGTAALANTAGYSGTATGSGYAGWARLQTVKTGYDGAAATFRIDGDVGTASTCTFVINTTTIVSGGVVTLLTAPISMA